MRQFFYFFMIVVSSAAQAQVYQRVDPVTGQITYTNRPTPGVEVKDDPVSTLPAAAADPQPTIDKRQTTKRVQHLASVTSPAVFPRIHPAEQKQRDLDRQAILSDELQAEIRALKQLGEKPKDEQAARRHHANIASLKRELAHLR